MHKLFCYVDETGQDTRGRFFLVAVVVTGQEREETRKLLMAIEARSGKGRKKWTKATLRQKRAYIQDVIALQALHGHLFCAEFSHTTEYLSCLIEAIVRAVARKAPETYKATILIDGLDKSKRTIVGARLRLKRISVEKVRGVRDESDEFIRLADAVAGFVRDALEGHADASTLYQEALSQGVLEHLWNIS